MNASAQKIFPKLLPFLLVLLVFLVFLNSLPYEFSKAWDDYAYVVNNEAVKGWSWNHIRMAFTKEYVGNYAPVHILSYTLDHSLWGLSAAGFRFTNILIHAANAVLVFVLILQLGGTRIVAAIAAAIFAIHPVQVESVVWISQRKTVLSLFFFILSFILYLKYTREGKWVNYLGSLMMFTFSLLTKSVAVVLPVLILLYHFLLERSGKKKKQIKTVIPYLLLTFFFSYITLVTHNPESSAGFRGGGIVSYHGGTPYTTFLTMIPVLIRYIKMVLFPFNLSALYSPPIYTEPTWQVMTSALMLILLILCLIYFRKNKQILFWTSWAFVCLIPVMQFIPLITIINDRYLYYPLMGLSAVTACLLSSLWNRTKTGKARLLLACCIGIAGVLMATSSIARNSIWRDRLSMWSDAAGKAPNNSIAHANLGAAYMELGLNQKAMESLSKSVEIDPQSAGSYGMLSMIFIQQEQFDRAETNIRKAIEIDPSLGWFRSILGNVYLGQSRYEEAWLAYRDALERDNRFLYDRGFKEKLVFVSSGLRPLLEENINKDPKDLESRFTLGNIDLLLGNYDLAQKAYKEMLTFEPAHVGALEKMAVISIRRMNFKRAEEFLKKAITADARSESAHLTLGMLYLREHRREEGRKHLEKALDLTDDPQREQRIRKMLRRLK